VANEQIGFTANPLPESTSYAWIGYAIAGLALCCCCCFVTASYVRDRRARERVYYEDPMGGGYEVLMEDGNVITIAEPVDMTAGYHPGDIPRGIPVDGGTYAVLPPPDDRR
jgi:hypothetical protein